MTCEVCGRSPAKRQLCDEHSDAVARFMDGADPQNIALPYGEIMQSLRVELYGLYGAYGDGKDERSVELGKRGGMQTAKRGPEYFRQIAAMRKTNGGGRPRKVKEVG